MTTKIINECMNQIIKDIENYELINISEIAFLFDEKEIDIKLKYYEDKIKNIDNIDLQKYNKPEYLNWCKTKIKILKKIKERQEV